MKPVTAWTLLPTLGLCALFCTPPALEALRPPTAREAWKRDWLSVPALDVARSMVEGDRRVVVLDIREDEEFAQFRIPHARHVRLRDLKALDLETLRGADLVIPYCLKDLRGFEALRVLRSRGIESAALFDGFGLAAWEAARLPVAGTLTGMDDGQAALDLLELTGRSALGAGP